MEISTLRPVAGVAHGRHACLVGVVFYLVPHCGERANGLLGGGENVSVGEKNSRMLAESQSM